MSFITKAFEITEKGFDSSVEAVEEWNEHRHAQRLLLKLGVAVYAEQRLGNDHDTVERIMKALDGHVAEHGEVELDHLRVAKDVLGEDFVVAHSGDAEPTDSELDADTGATTPTT
ncbi:hypothetical protein NE236_01830 [Actinoallomurus purpureus]|uniref:hypothetical protein n=1 Tax=Actinoallomurus purpureus TaxID=478114 RepID=UPI00209229F2|nr:hypothetical protein [Actinoallomurus purpureus]MCO6003707.1 hypothetical protein [Actinoallomurus purpureus]